MEKKIKIKSDSRLKTRNSRLRGFTLIEILVSVVVATFLIVGISMLLLLGIQASADAKAKTKASKIAQNKIEDLRTQDFTTAIFNAPATQTAALSPSDGLKNGQITTKISAIDADMNGSIDSSAKIREVKITISWTGAKGKTKLESVTARIYENGL